MDLVATIRFDAQMPCMGERLTTGPGLNPLSTHFSQIRVSDLILVNEEGDVVQGDQPINAAAFAIHSAIHKRRPDVHAAYAKLEVLPPAFGLCTDHRSII